MRIRFFSRATQLVIDLAALSTAYWLAFLLRFEGDIPLQWLKLAVFLWPYVVVLQHFSFVAFGVHRFAWRYVSLREVKRISLATAGQALVLIGIRFAAGLSHSHFGYLQYLLIPFGVILIDSAFVFLAITGVRAARRLQAERSESSSRPNSSSSTPTLLIGAGQAGVIVAREIAARPDLGIAPIGFVDDDPKKTGLEIHGLRVIGTTADLASLCKKRHIDQALITIANAPGRDIRRIVQRCEASGLPTKIIPGIFEIVGGKVNLSRIRPVAIDDLLGREPTNLDIDAVEGVVRGRRVLVTGAGGSIGSELCRQIARISPSELIVLDQAETGLFYMHRELVESDVSCAVRPILADICDSAAMACLFEGEKIDVVFHAAAYKHVPVLEASPAQAVNVNIRGTRALADLASLNGVSTFVLISTDKAVNPSSVMGASKRVAELYIQALSQQSSTTFVAVRFGNVLGSTGSVVPIFKEQIARGGPVTVTHPEMKRYFMTIPEACQLVLQAGSMGRGGEIMVLDMGEPVKIVDLARDLIRLSGLREGEDIEIAFVGMRPGEKLAEELSSPGEYADRTRHPKIFVGRLRPAELGWVIDGIRRLERSSLDGGSDEIRAGLKHLVPEYEPAGA